MSHSKQNWLHKLYHSPRQDFRRLPRIPLKSTETGCWQKLQDPLGCSLVQNISMPPGKHAFSLSAGALRNQYTKTTSTNIFSECFRCSCHQLLRTVFYPRNSTDFQWYLIQSSLPKKRCGCYFKLQPISLECYCVRWGFYMSVPSKS